MIGEPLLLRRIRLFRVGTESALRERLCYYSLLRNKDKYKVYVVQTGSGPLHRLEPAEVTERRELDSITQPNPSNTFNNGTHGQIQQCREDVDTHQGPDTLAAF